MDVEAARARLTEAWNGIHNGGDRNEWLTAGSAYWVMTHPELADFTALDPNRLPSVEETLRLADLINQANAGVHEVIGTEWPRELDYAAQLAFFYEVLDGLYRPFSISLKRARGGGWLGIEPLIRFLEADPFCFRSGYFKADAIDALTRMDLEPEHHARLLAVLLNRLDKPTTTEFRHFIRLARHLETPELRRFLEEKVAVDVQPGSRHARWILAGLVEGRGYRRLLASPRRRKALRSAG